MTSQEIQQYVWTWLRNKGLNEKATAGIMGNISQESSWDSQEIEVGGGGGFGLCQWTDQTGSPRGTQLEAYGTDLDHQLEFLWSEMTEENLSQTGATKQWYNAQGYTYYDFFAGNYSPSESAAAFCWCWERPDSAQANLTYRQSQAESFYTRYQGTSGGSSTDDGIKVEDAVKWMIDIANDDRHGYDQDNRWGPDYDCSSFVISGYEQAGIPLKTNGATYTGDLKAVALSTGFTLVDWGNDETKLVRGDILLNEIHHTAVYIGNGKIVQASANENGTATGGQAGDQTGREIYVRDYYVYSSGWDYVLRYGNGAIAPPSPNAGQVWTKIVNSSYNINQLTAEQTNFLKTLSFNDLVKITYTFDRRKYNGVNFTGKRLTIDDKSYIIVDVENNGFIKLTNDINNKCYKFVNPKLIKEG